MEYTTDSSGSTTLTGTINYSWNKYQISANIWPAYANLASPPSVFNRNIADGQGSGVLMNPAQPTPTQNKTFNPCGNGESDVSGAAEYVLDFTGSTADAASLGLGGAGLLAAEAPPVAAALEVGAGVAQGISLGAGLISAGIKAYQGNYFGAATSLGSSAIGRFGAGALGKLAGSFGTTAGNKLAREAQATAASQAVGRAQCPR